MVATRGVKWIGGLTIGQLRYLGADCLSSVMKNAHFGQL